MAQTASTMLPLGTPAPVFSLLEPATGKTVALADVQSAPALLVMFICNHCPFVKHIRENLVLFAQTYQQRRLAIIAINANDAAHYPHDSPAKMAEDAQAFNYPFPYLYDETQAVARAYGAECTPDFFGYNAKGELQYRGRLDASGRSPGDPDARRELYEAMAQIAETGQGPQDQIASIGCSIKWKA